MKSMVRNTGSVELPLIEGEFAMIPFDMETLIGVPKFFIHVVEKMLENIPRGKGTAFLTIHGKKLKSGETLRRPGAHVDGNYEPHTMDFSGGGNGWKTGEEGRPVGHPTHTRQFCSDKGGIIMVSNYHACNGWVGEYEGYVEKGGDCTHLDLGEPFMLEPDTIYYGNNHFIHESLPVDTDCHRVLARITLPEDHLYIN